MNKNDKVIARALTVKEKADMEKDVYDSFAKYLCYCPECRYVERSNMYLMRAREHIAKLRKNRKKCPGCGKCIWELGYPDGTKTGFVDFE